MRGEGMLWLGAREIGLKRLDHGWRDVPLPRPEDRPGVEYLANTRMHLTQSQMNLPHQCRSLEGVSPQAASATFGPTVPAG